MKTLTIEPRSAAVVGLLLTVPLALLNAIIGDRVEPFFSLIRPGLHTSPGEYVLLVAVLLLLPMGAVIAIRPMLETRRLYLVNAAVAALLLVAFVAVSIGLGSDIYRCDVLRIPNCD
jgi:hypothetical protein